MDRVSTGIEELDRKLSGGYPVNKVTLITGIAGSGKTIFGSHFIYKNPLLRERTAYYRKYLREPFRNDRTDQVWVQA